ncbi:FG-GAP-like repeat-containing protein [Streptomyces sp. UC4497]
MLLPFLRARRPRRRIVAWLAGLVALALVAAALVGVGLWVTYDARTGGGKPHPKGSGGTGGSVGEAMTDFDGNGHADLVMPAPSADVAGKHGAGAIGIQYGSPAGPGIGRQEVLSRAMRTPIGQLAAGVEHFGRESAAADLDGDGYTDLLTRDEAHDLVLWGSDSGLFTGSRTDFAHAGVGDFDGDGQADVLVRDKGLSVLFGPFGRGGSPERRAVYSKDRRAALDAGIYVHLVVGDLTADGRSDVLVTHSPEPGDWRWRPMRGFMTGRDGRAETAYEYRHLQGGTDGVIADFDGDGHNDFASHLVRENDSTGLRDDYDAGRIEIAYGSKTGNFLRTQVVRHKELGIVGLTGDDGRRGTGPRDQGDRLGGALAAGDVNGDGRADLVASAPGTDAGAALDTGAVYLLMGSAKGLLEGGTTDARGTGARPRALAYRQGLDGVPGVAESYDGFGSALWLGDMDGDHRADLAVGASGEDGRYRDAGAVWLLPGTQLALEYSAPVTSFGPATLGIPEPSLAGTEFGAEFGAGAP